MLKKMLVLLFVLGIANVCFAENTLYSLDESDGYIYCANHQELIWYIVEDSLEVDSEDDMLVIYADIVSLNTRDGKTHIYPKKFVYDEENNKMYFCNKKGTLRQLVYRGYWAGTGRHYYMANKAYYIVNGEYFDE